MKKWHKKRQSDIVVTCTVNYKISEALRKVLILSYFVELSVLIIFIKKYFKFHAEVTVL
jgi:hypothetical protein